MKTFDLYFDESGNFEESPIVTPAAIQRTERPQFSSQLVGILAPAGELTKESADSILQKIHTDLKHPLGDQLHATETHDDSYYQPLVQKTVRALRSREWQPVRLLNSERLGYGDKTATYTNMVAEFVVRILQRLSAEHTEGVVSLNITGATVMLKEQGGEGLTRLEEKEYLSRMNEYISMLAVRYGIAYEHRRWEVSSFRLLSGRYHRALQLCDVLSNASFKNFRRCSIETKKLFVPAFGVYDFTLTNTDLLNQIDYHRLNGSLALSLQTIAETWFSRLHPTIKAELKKRLELIVDQLSRLPAETRNIQLRQLSDWVAQYLELRNLLLCEQMSGWLEQHVALPLIEACGDTLRSDVVWFLAMLLNLRLGQHNHRGEIFQAKALSERLENLYPLLSANWEHAPLLTKAMTFRAVHLNDCCEYDKASRIMGAAADYYAGLSSLMADAMPGVFPERVRSRHRGIALGTRLQSEMYAGLSDPSRFEIARTLSDEALDEFTAYDDLARQQQYRCQLETFAGKCTEAREWLAKSLSCTAIDHAAIAGAIETLSNGRQGFALLHWSRIALAAARTFDSKELDAFIQAFDRSPLSKSGWVMASQAEYPAHGIRKHLSVAFAGAGRYKESWEFASRLERLETVKMPALVLIRLAGLLEVAALWSKEQPDRIATILEGQKKDQKSLMQQLQAFADDTAQFSALHTLVSALQEGARQYSASGYQNNGQLLKACSLVGQ